MISLAETIVPGALAPVKWERACDGFFGDSVTARFWRAVPPTSDYVALGAIGMSGELSIMFEQPPQELAKRFRAVHKQALDRAVTGVQHEHACSWNAKNVMICRGSSTIVVMGDTCVSAHIEVSSEL